MHEFSVCRALIDQVEALVRERDADRAVRIEVSIGPLSGIEAALLRQAYSLCSTGTCADGARLVIETSKVRVRCLPCGAESDATASNLLCRSCGSWRTQLLTGDELLLVSVELQRAQSSAGGHSLAPDSPDRTSRVPALTSHLP